MPGKRCAELGQSFAYLYRLRPSLPGHEIVVASSNSKAVENISRQIPGIDAIAEDLEPPLRYFASVSDYVASRGCDPNIREGATWGLSAAILGKSENKSTFAEAFWWDRQRGLGQYLLGLAIGRAAPAASPCACVPHRMRVHTQKGGSPVAIELDHIILAVNDRAQSVDFYTRVIGLNHDGEREPFSMLRVTPRFVIQIAQWGTTGGEHLAFAMSKQEFDGVFARVKESGIAYGDQFDSVGNMKGPGNEAASRGMGKAVYFFDPNKHLIEIRHYEL